jgi:hypothetical protein
MFGSNHRKRHTHQIPTIIIHHDASNQYFCIILLTSILSTSLVHCVRELERNNMKNPAGTIASGHTPIAIKYRDAIALQINNMEDVIMWRVRHNCLLQYRENFYYQ